MNEKAKALKARADRARILFKQRLITYAEARCEIMPYINYYNERTVEIAKKYDMPPKKINFSSFIR